MIEGFKTWFSHETADEHIVGERFFFNPLADITPYEMALIFKYDQGLHLGMALVGDPDFWAWKVVRRHYTEREKRDE
jgi:hypothetical protein